MNKMIKAVVVCLVLATCVLAFDPHACESWNLCGNMTLTGTPGSFYGCCTSMNGKCVLESSAQLQIGTTTMASGWYLMMLNTTTVPDSNIQIYLPVVQTTNGSFTTWSIGLMGPTQYIVSISADCVQS